MYAIMFDLDTEALAQSYHSASYHNAYGDIGKALEGHGFTRQQGSIYFGDVSKVDAVSCVLAVMDLAKANPWFAPSVRDIRMLRIEDNSDLMPAVQEAVACSPSTISSWRFGFHHDVGQTAYTLQTEVNRT